jgi:hypothetical protein
LIKVNVFCIMDKPYVIDLPEIEGKRGKLSFIEEPVLSFSIKRVYWIYDSVEGVAGGNHAHLNANRIIICTQGKAHFHLESPDGELYEFIMDHPARGLYCPSLHWISYTLHDDATLMVLVDTLFKDDVTIADYTKFKHRKFGT